MKKLTLIVIVFLLCGCSTSRSLDGIDIDKIYKSFDSSFSFIHENFYCSTPHWVLDPDYEHCDENHACRSNIFSSLVEFKDYMVNYYSLSQSFTDKLIKRRYPDLLYEKDDGLYVIDADSGGDFSIGKELKRRLIRQSENTIVLKVWYEFVDLTDFKVKGSFEVDNVAVLIEGQWLWDDIPEVY